jgi:hypothetical protein
MKFKIRVVDLYDDGQTWISVIRVGSEEIWRSEQAWTTKVAALEYAKETLQYSLHKLLLTHTEGNK